MAFRRTIAKLWSISMSSGGISSNQATISNANNKMLILSESAVAQCLDMRSCLDVNRQALVGKHTGEATVPTRLGVPYYPPSSMVPSSETSIDPADWTLFKPASWVRNPTASSSRVTESIGIKVVSVRSQNPVLGLPLVPASILHVDAATGIVDAVIAGTFATACRTAAGSALAAEVFVRAHRKNHSTKQPMANTNDNNTCSSVGTTIMIFGAGMQAEQHICAFSKALGDRPLPNVIIINRTEPRAQRLRQHAIEQEWVEANGCQVVLMSDRNKILECFRSRHNSDDGLRFKILATCTNTINPLWDDEMARVLAEENDRVIICGVGSYTPSTREVPTETIRCCTGGGVWVDTMDARPVGDLSPLTNDDACKDIPIQLVGKVLHEFDNHLSSEIGGFVFYKSVGTAIQDVLTADLIVKRARELNLGIEVDMS